MIDGIPLWQHLKNNKFESKEIEITKVIMAK